MVRSGEGEVDMGDSGGVDAGVLSCETLSSNEICLNTCRVISILASSEISLLGSSVDSSLDSSASILVLLYRMLGGSIGLNGGDNLIVRSVSQRSVSVSLTIFAECEGVSSLPMTSHASSTMTTSLQRNMAGFILQQ